VGGGLEEQPRNRVLSGCMLATFEPDTLLPSFACHVGSPFDPRK
jgi:hypothetical protein